MKPKKDTFLKFRITENEKKLINRRNHEFTEILKFQAILNNAIKKH